MSLRALAAQTITHVISDGKSLADLMPAAQQKCDDPRDKALLKELVFGTLRHLRRLAALREQLLSQKLKEPNGALANLLLVGLYQLFYTRVPGHAAVAATVDAVDAINEPRARGLVNAILRRAQREGEQKLKVVDRSWELLHSHPNWFIDTLKQQDKDSLLAILEANNHPAPMTLRVNRQKTTREQYHAKLNALGINATAHPEASDALVLQDAMDVQQLPGFADGEVSVQDAAAQLTADYLQLAPGLRVLDACAAPGGKTAHMLERQSGLQMLALDNDNGRLQRVQENLNRLQLSATLRCADANQTKAWWDGKPFDRILLDAPCSGTGVIRRHPDIKWLRRARDIPALAETQLGLLNALWPTLDQHGLLLYATCSALAEENARVIDRFLTEHSSAKLLPLPGQNGEPAGRVIRCGEQDMDGFFYALLQKGA